MKCRLAILLGSAVQVSLGCGSTSDDASNADTEAVTADKKSAGLTAADFAAPVTQASIRATNPELTDAEFAVKWTAATADALSFLRAFPPAFHSDLAQVAAARTPGSEGLCLGDAHPENFGWMSEAGQTFLAANDFDDSGYCPVAFDAARFFVATSLEFGDDALTASAIAQYVATVAHPKKAVAVDMTLAPSWTKVQTKDLNKSTAGNSFVLGAATSLSAVDTATRSAVAAWFAGESLFAGSSLLDVAAYAHNDGGSAELPRYWLLLSHSGTEAIVELKTEVKPGVAWGRHTQTLSNGARFLTLTSAFWPERDPDDTFGATLTDPSVAAFYLVRDRLQRDSLDFTKLSSKQSTNVLLAEVSELAKVHAAAWAGTSASQMTSWLTGTTTTLTARWQAAWQTAHGSD